MCVFVCEANKLFNVTRYSITARSQFVLEKTLVAELHKRPMMNVLSHPGTIPCLLTQFLLAVRSPAYKYNFPYPVMASAL